MCPLCDARVDCFYAVNRDFDTNPPLNPAADRWTAVFPEDAAADAAEAGPGQSREQDLLGGTGDASAMGVEEWPDDEEEDRDFGESSVSDDGADDEDEPLSGSAYADSDAADSDADSVERRVREAMAAAPEVLQGKRRRTVVDYRALNDEMFGSGEAFEGEADDEAEGGWGPVSPGGADARSKGGISLVSARQHSTSQPISGVGGGAETSSSTGAAKKRKRVPTAAAAAASVKIGAAAKGAGKGATRAEGVTKGVGGRAGVSGLKENAAGTSASKGVNAKETPRGTRGGGGGGGAGRRGVCGGDGSGGGGGGSGGRGASASGGRGTIASPMLVGQSPGRASARSNDTTPGHKRFPPRWGIVQGSELRV
jgi:hypothetical protein